MQLANVTARLLASLKGQGDQENLFDWKKANDTATFKRARKKIWGTTGWSASLQSHGKLQNKALWKPFQAHEIPGDGSNQSTPIYQGCILSDHPDCHPRGNDCLLGGGEAADVIHLDHSKAFNSVSHSSLVAGLRI